MKKLTLTSLFYFICCNLFATHIVGGGFSLKWISGNTYELTLNVMRDCKNSNVGFDDPATVGVFDKRTNMLKQTYQMSLTSQETLNFASSNCSSPVLGECTSLGIYKRRITLDPLVFNNNDGYYFSYQRCCRNNIVQNILDPGLAGIAIYMEIPSARFIINSTPYFTANPNTYLCVGNLTKYNFGFKDDDNDELHYALVTPLNGNLNGGTPSSTSASAGPYPTVNWAGSHSDAREILGNPSLSINEKTGELSVNPVQAGIYAVAVQVSEYRFGQKLGEVRLEIQFTVTECPQPIPEILLKDINGNLTSSDFQIDAPGKVCFDITASDPTDSLFLTINNTSPDTGMANKPVFERYVEGLKNISTRVCWQVDCSHDSITTQTFDVEVRDNGCPVSTRATASFSMTARPMPLVNPTDILCMTLVNNQETIFYWGDSTGQNPYFSKYIIYRNADTSFLTLDSVSNKSTRQYHDKNTPGYDVINYRYFMRAQNQCGIEGPPSDTLGTFEQLKFIPDQQKLITVSVCDKTKLKVIWPRTPEKDFARYLVYKARASDKNYTLVHTYTNVDDTVFIDPDVDVMNSSYCYHVIMKDTCDNYGPQGREGCSILLKGKAAPFANTLTWTPYTYWDNGTENYEVVSRGNETSTPLSTIVSVRDTSYKDASLDAASGFFTYYVVAHQNGSNVINNRGNGYSAEFYIGQSFSNEVELSQRPLVYIPNAFTPNNDDLNESWDIRNIFVKDYHLSIYNKWGQLIFETTDKRQSWNGSSKDGDIEPTDVYIYQLFYTGFDNSAYTKKGNVTILR